ncbi:MAG: phage gp6-like head-tail connector protein [Bacilli bacterium]|nr:phage gp6-like head-tail connector protein [Bacilli bacterium]
MIEKVSKITYIEVANYLKVDIRNDILLQEELNTYLKVAKNYISNYTGIPETSENKDDETLDTYSDFIIVVLILCQDMYDNRSMYVESKNINNVIQTILDMHRRVNLG